MNPTGKIVDARLRRASELSAGMRTGTPRVDMSGPAIELRLRQVSDLSRACLQLESVGAAARRGEGGSGERVP